MKRKLIVAMVLVAGVAILIALGVRWINSSSTQPESASSTNQLETTASGESDREMHVTSSAPSDSVSQNPGETNVLPSPAVVASTADVDYVSHRIELLDKLSMNDDAGSLQVILSELTNSDARIRKAALEATIQFDSADAIPTLKQDAAIAQDPVEKQALLDAAKFLALPSIAESGITIVPRSKNPAQIPAPSAN